MTELAGTRVRLRSLRTEDAEVLAASREPNPMFPDRSSDEVRDRVRDLAEENPTLDEAGFVELVIELEGRVVGDIQARAPKDAYPPGVCEIGITVFRDVRGCGLGAEAVTVFTDHLLAQGWARVQASTSVGNASMRRVLERSGYKFEGVLRRFGPGLRGREDYAMYAAV